MKDNRRLFLISNMYPSTRNVRYGVFVKNFEQAIRDYYEIHKIVMTKKRTSLGKIIAYVVLYLKIVQLLFKANKEDIIYVHFPLHMAPILRILVLFKKKIVLNFHGSDLIFDNLLTKLLSLFLAPLIKRLYIVVPSKYYKEKILAQWNVSQSKILIYPSGGINRKIFFKLDKIKDQNFTIGYVSNFIEEKGWLLLLEAIKKIEKQALINNLKVIMIGDGPDKINIEQVASTLRTEVTILSNIEQEKLVDYYNRFDVFAFPTYREAESLGLVGLEAMACGIPVIAGKVGGPMGYIKEGYNGFLFAKKNSKELTDKIIQFYNLSHFERVNMSLNCIRTSSNYDSNKVRDSLIKFLDQLIQKKVT